MSSALSLGPHFRALVDDLVESGRYESEDEVLREGLRLLEAREDARSASVAALREAIEFGLASGPAEPLDMSEIRAEARRLKAIRPG